MLTAIDFDFETAQTYPDTRLNYGEELTIALGLIANRPHVLVFTLRKNKVRVISLRRANRKKSEAYYHGKK